VAQSGHHACHAFPQAFSPFMTAPNIDPLFAGSIPEIYDRYLVPLIFEPYAEDLAARLVGEGSESVLEIAAGTGVVARALAQRLPDHVSITATDLNVRRYRGSCHGRARALRVSRGRWFDPRIRRRR
jgi:hypothetical protein